MDSKLTLLIEQTGEGFYVAQFKTSELAIYSYYIESQQAAVLIDPVFNVQVYSDFIQKRHTTLKYVFLTHYHADYLSGHTQYKVPIVMGPESTRSVNKFEIKQAKDNQTLSFGNVSIRVIHTPGHTLESSCYVLTDSNHTDVAIFSGDTVFLGEVGRPDLASNEQLTSADLAGFLYDSVQKIKKLDGSIRLYPGHGAGSACGKSIGTGNFCTLANQFTDNYGFKFTSREQFVKEVSNGIAKPPKYFFFDAGLNQTGTHPYKDSFDKSHVGLNQEQFQKLRSTLTVIDTRINVGQGILKGSYWLPSNGAIISWIANLIGPEQEFLIVTELGQEQDIIDRFFRIGYFKIRGFNNFNLNELKEQWVRPTTLNFNAIKQLQNVVHLDVRNVPEYRSTGVVSGSILIPLPDLQNRLEELKDKKNLVVNCLSGNRARVAFSILARHGLQSKVLVENFKQFKENGFNVVDYQG